MKKEENRSVIVKMNFDRLTKEKNLKQKEVAKRMCCEPQTLSGHLKNPNITDETKDRIAEAIGVDRSDLLMSEADNQRLTFTRERERYYRTTWRGRAVMFGSMFFLFYVVYMYQDALVALFGMLSMMLIIDNFGLLDPVGTRKPNIIDKILKILIRIMEATGGRFRIIYSLIVRWMQALAQNG